MAGSLLHGNAAGASGGALYVPAAAQVHVARSELVGNTASAMGGAFYLEHCPQALLAGAALAGNVAGGAGGAVYLANVSAATVNCSFQGNRADKQARALVHCLQPATTAACTHMRSARMHTHTHSGKAKHSPVSNEVETHTRAHM